MSAEPQMRLVHCPRCDELMGWPNDGTEPGPHDLCTDCFPLALAAAEARADRACEEQAATATRLFAAESRLAEVTAELKASREDCEGLSQVVRDYNEGCLELEAQLSEAKRRGEALAKAVDDFRTRAEAASTGPRSRVMHARFVARWLEEMLTAFRSPSSTSEAAPTPVEGSSKLKLNSASTAQMEAYLRLESAAVLLDDLSPRLADDLRDVMDGVWRQLGTDDIARLNSRVPLPETTAPPARCGCSCHRISPESLFCTTCVAAHRAASPSEQPEGEDEHRADGSCCPGGHF